jgi:hypothetical protein
MADHKLAVGDESKADSQVNPGVEPAPRDKYKVIAEGGMFKNGKAYKNGQLVELDEVTAERAIAAGDVEKV